MPILPKENYQQKDRAVDKKDKRIMKPSLLYQWQKCSRLYAWYLNLLAVGYWMTYKFHNQHKCPCRFCVMFRDIHKIGLIVVVSVFIVGICQACTLQERLDRAGPKLGGSSHEWVKCPYCGNDYARGEDEQYHSCFQNKHLRRIEIELKELREDLIK